MKVRIKKINDKADECIIIECVKVTADIESISPALNGRFTAHMKNGEKIIISRKYVPEIKLTLLGGN